MRLLMAAPGPPSGSGKGYQVRLYNQILGLAGNHQVSLLAFAGADELDRELVAACKKVTIIPWSVAKAATSAIARTASLPLSVGLYRNRRMAAAVSAEIKSASYDLIQLQLVRMAPYMEETAGLPTVLDLLDAAELNMRERARAASPGVSQLLEAEARRLGAYERAAIARANLSLLISQRDLTYLGDPPNARLLPNGIEPLPLLLVGERAGSTVVFTGTMSYFPNADAAKWFATEIWPLVRRAVPSAMCRIVGREPGTSVRRLASVQGVTVTGAVQQISQELARATVSVCPMRFGSGMQTKILEAMAVATPVVATSKALEGIPPDLHRFLHKADSAEEFANSVVRILKEPGPGLKLAGSGLAVISSDHTWRRHVSDLASLYEETVASSVSGRQGR